MITVSNRLACIRYVYSKTKLTTNSDRWVTCILKFGFLTNLKKLALCFFGSEC